MTTSNPAPTLCACGCGRTFTLPPSAPHKRFASASCRKNHYLARAKKARELLDQQERNHRLETESHL